MNLISSFSDYTRNRRKEVYMNVCVQCLLRVDHQLIIKSRKKRKYDHFKDMKQVLFVVDSIAQVKWLLSHRSNQTINEIIIKGQKEK